MPFLPKVSAFVFVSVVYFAQPSLQGRTLKGSVGLSMVNHFNQTGHCTIDFELSQVFRGSKRSWRANIKHDVYENGGLEEHVVKGLLTAPPPKPSDYELFPGIGFYKFHPEERTFADSLKGCTAEGGHLAVINSIPEANVLKTLYARHSDVWSWAHIGFHDPRESGTRGNYVTIFGESLKNAGYDKWDPDEPDHTYGQAYCGVINRDVLLGAGVCTGKKRPFFCEYDLSWGV